MENRVRFWDNWRLLAVAIFALLGIGVGIIGGFGLWGSTPPGTPIAPNLDQTRATATFTWTLPTGWRSELWQGDQIQQKAASLASTQQPMLEAFLTRFAPDTKLLVGYPSHAPDRNASDPSQAHRLYAFSVARQGLRLPQVMDIFTQRLQTQPDVSDLQSSIGQAARPDGQPAARIRYQLVGSTPADQQTDVSLALLVNPIADALIFVMEVDHMPKDHIPKAHTSEEDNILDQVVAGIRW